jgi:hypothetical protein
LRSWSKKNFASASLARSTRSLPATIAPGSRVARFETTRKRARILPCASVSAKYFWFCCIVRIRHSCGTARNAGSNVPGVDDRPLDQRVDLVEQRVGRDRAVALRGLRDLALDRRAARVEARDHLALGLERGRVRVGRRELDRAARQEPVAGRLRPASSPSALTGTTSAPWSATRPCAGRTNFSSFQ